MEFFWSMGQFFVLLSHVPYKKSEELPLACLFDVFTGLWLSTFTFCIKGYDYVEGRGEATHLFFRWVCASDDPKL